MAALTLTAGFRALPAAGTGPAPWLAGASFAATTQALMVPGLLPGMAEGLGVTVAQAGQATTVFALAAAVAAIPVARAIQGGPARLLLCGALAALAALNLMAAAAPSLSFLLALRALGGVVAALVLPLAPALATGLADPGQRPRALAAVTFGTVAGFGLGLPAASLAAAWFDWRAAFALAGLLSLGAALAAGAVLPAGLRVGAPGQARLKLLCTAGVPGILALVALAFASVFATQAFLGPIAASTFGGSAAPLQMLMAAGALLGVRFGLWLAERFAGRAPAAIALALLVAAAWQWALLAIGQPSPALQGGQIVLATAALFAVSPVLQARLVALLPTARPLVLSANFVAVSLGQAGGAAAGGFGLDQAGLAGAASLGVLAAGAMLVIAAHDTRRFRD
jgi:DHA1 family inner membrane transport protein